MIGTNAKEEFLEHVGVLAVKCATLSKGYYEEKALATLKVGHNSEDYTAFLYKLDFEYDSGYGGQELYGTIWYTDGTWSSRGEYDGSEWWEHNVMPEIPEELQ